jgi:hypothetical protein
VAADGIDIEINEPAFDALLRDVSRDLIADLATATADTARGLAPVQHRTDPMVRHRRPPGHGGTLKASVTTIEGDDDDGTPYADVASMWYGRFLDPRARQLHRLYPFLPSALYDAVDGRTFYL